MPKYRIDYSISGIIDVEAGSDKDAVEKVEEMDINLLLENAELFSVGKQCIEEIKD
jgi:hypothetical protein